jgi:hypothetical protein
MGHRIAVVAVANCHLAISPRLADPRSESTRRLALRQEDLPSPGVTITGEHDHLKRGMMHSAG